MHHQELVKLLSSGNLDEHIEGFYVFNSDKVQSRHLLFNDGFPALVLMPSANHRSYVQIADQRFPVGAAWICGGLMKRVFWEPGITSGEILIIRFQPFSFFNIFNLNAGIFTSRPVYDFCEITGHVFKNLIDTFYKCLDLKQKVKLIESFISNRQLRQAYPHLLKEGIRYIQVKQGDLSVKELSCALGLNLNYKWWERTFKKHLGLSPQRYIQSQRFFFTYVELEESPQKELIEVAINNGYYDMNHMVKNFREYTGEPPRTFFRQT